MRYEKPRLAVMAAAIATIQSGTCNKGSILADSHGCTNNHVTVGAYEADE